jgi:hypothetical protein
MNKQQLIDIASISASRFDDMVSDFIWDTISDLGVDFENPSKEKIEEAMSAVESVKYIDPGFKEKTLNMLEDLLLDFS